MKIAVVAVIACLSLSSAAALAQGANSEVARDAERLADCVNKKAGPEGDLPPSGPLREQMMADMAGGPQMCVGLIYNDCMKSSKDARVCNRREGMAWMEALKLGSQDRKRFARRNIEVYDNAVRRIRGQARALCHAAASISAWGSEAVAKGTFERSDIDTSGCEREAIAQQALMIMVTARGN